MFNTVVMTLSEATAIRDTVKNAYLEALSARAVGYGDKSVSRQTIGELRHELDSWERIVADLQRAVLGTPRAAIATWRDYSCSR